MPILFRLWLLGDGLGGGLRWSGGGGRLTRAEEEQKGEREDGSFAPSGPSTAGRFSDFILRYAIDRSYWACDGEEELEGSQREGGVKRRGVAG